MSYENVRVLPTINGRYGIYARKEKGQPWVQIESISHEREAEERAVDLDHFEGQRAFEIDDALTLEETHPWGDDTAINPPTE